MKLDIFQLGANEKNATARFLFQMEKLVFIQTNLRMLESMRLMMPFKNQIPMNSTLPRFLLCLLGRKLKITIFSCMMKELSHLNMCHANGNLSV